VLKELVVRSGNDASVIGGAVSELIPRSSVQFVGYDKVSPKLSLAGSIGSFTSSSEFGKIIPRKVYADIPKKFERKSLNIRIWGLYKMSLVILVNAVDIRPTGMSFK